MDDNEKVIELSGPESGPVSIILAGVHGDEICGVRALEKIVPGFKIKRGTVFFGYGNPRAIKRNIRFTEANLNRMFKEDGLLSGKEKSSYEYARSRYLIPYLDRSEALLDLHASFVSESEPFVICEDQARGIVQYFPQKIVLSGLDDIEPGGTDCYMNKNGKTGICVECGYLGDQESVNRAEEALMNFLAARGHIEKDLKAYPRKNFFRACELYVTKTKNFKLAREFEDFEEIPQGGLVGLDGTEEIRVSRDSIILFARSREAEGEEAFVLGERVF